MPSTYIQLTNQLLRRLNEVEIAQADFANVRGVQALAKDAVQSAIRKINAVDFEWPFNAAEHTQVLTVGQEEYTWPENFKICEWDSFQVQADTSLGINFSELGFIDRSVWYEYYRSDDQDSGVLGLDVPTMVFPSHGNGYGVTPSPDKAYTITFRYFRSPATLVNYGDASSIPEVFDEVIIQGALYYMYMFRDNSEQAQLTERAFQKAAAEMEGVLVHKYDRVIGSVVAWGRYGR